MTRTIFDADDRFDIGSTEPATRTEARSAERDGATPLWSQEDRHGAPYAASVFADTGVAFARPLSGTGTTAATSAGGQLPTYSNSQIAEYLRVGYWEDVGDAPHHFNMGSTGLGANSGVLRYNVSELSSTGTALAERALKLYGEVLDIEFQRTTSTGSSVDIFFENTDRNEAYTWANFYTSTGAITSAHVNIGSGWISKYGSGTASYSFQTFLHEIGHALGLGHAGDYDGEATYVSRTSDPDYGDDSNFYLNDSWQRSVMSYFSQDDNTSVSADKAFLLSPMVADYMALAEIYGDDIGGFDGDTTWGFNTNIGTTVFANLQRYADDMAFTIIDGGGRDTIDFSGFSEDQRIDLTPQRYSSIGGLSENMSIASGTVIENATGGAGDDTLLGNGAANVLRGLDGADKILGNAGADTLRGGAGADTLTGGKGADVLIGGAGADVFRLTSTGDSPGSAPDVLRAGDGAAAFDGAGSAAGDLIDLSPIDARAGTSGNQAFLFGGGTGQGHLWLTTDGSDTVLKGNVDADRGSDFQLVIEDGATLASAYAVSDFIL